MCCNVWVCPLELLKQPVDFYETWFERYEVTRHTIAVNCNYIYSGTEA